MHVPAVRYSLFLARRAACIYFDEPEHLLDKGSTLGIKWR